MTNDVAHGLDLMPDGDDFVLSVTDDTSGDTNCVRLTADQVQTLGQSASAFRELILSRSQPKEGGVEAILVTVIEDVVLRPDALGENILMFLLAATRTQVTYALSPVVADRLLGQLGPSLIALRAADPTKQ